MSACLCLNLAYVVWLTHFHLAVNCENTKSSNLFYFGFLFFGVFVFFYRDAPFLLADIGFNSRQFIQQIRLHSQTAAADVCCAPSVWCPFLAQSGSLTSSQVHMCLDDTWITIFCFLKLMMTSFSSIDTSVDLIFRFQENSNQIQIQQNHFRPQ